MRKDSNMSSTAASDAAALSIPVSQSTDVTEMPAYEIANAVQIFWGHIHGYEVERLYR